MSVDFTIDVNEDDFAEKMRHLDRAMRDCVQQSIAQTAQETASRARQLAPFRTGRLAQATNAQALSNWTVKVSCNAPYALFQELGTRSIQPKLFLTRALQETAPKVVSVLSSALQQATSETNET